MTKVFADNLTEQFLMIHNDVIDKIMPFIPPAASNIIFFIYRKTRGWHKRADQISFSQIMKGTGIKSSATVAKHLDILTHLGILIRLKPGDRWEANSYILNSNFDTSTLKNEVGSTLKNEDTKDTEKKQLNTLTAGAVNEFSVQKEKSPNNGRSDILNSAEKAPPLVSGKEEPDSEFNNHFGPNPRQDEIDAHQKQERLSKDELLLLSLGAGVPSPVRAIVAQMRDSRWKINDGDIEKGIATFANVTGFPIPSSKRERKQWEAGVREHLGDEAFKGQLGRLYALAWEKLGPEVRDNGLTITHPMALTKTMRGIVLAKRPANGNGRLSVDQVLACLKKKGIVEIKSIGGGTASYFWTENGEEVTSIPKKYADMIYQV